MAEYGITVTVKIDPLGVTVVVEETLSDGDTEKSKAIDTVAV